MFCSESSQSHRTAQGHPVDYRYPQLRVFRVTIERMSRLLSTDVLSSMMTLGDAELKSVDFETVDCIVKLVCIIKIATIGKDYTSRIESLQTKQRNESDSSSPNEVLTSSETRLCFGATTTQCIPHPNIITPFTFSSRRGEIGFETVFRDHLDQYTS